MACEISCEISDGISCEIAREIACTIAYVVVLGFSFRFLETLLV